MEARDRPLGAVVSALLLAAMLSGPAEAGAFPGPEVIGAYEGNLRSGYAFGSVMSPSVDGKLMPVGRATVSYLYYRFPDGMGTGETRVLSPGLGLGVGLRWRPERLSCTLVAGYEVRYVQERPSAGPYVARADHGVSLSADVYFQASQKVALATSGYFGFAQNYLWVRALAKRQILPIHGTAITAFSLGVDGTVHGNDQARGADGGVFGELAFPGAQTALSLRVGVGRELQPGAQDAWVGVLGASVYKSF